MKTASEWALDASKRACPHNGANRRQDCSACLNELIAAAQRDAAASAYEEAAKVAFDILAERVEQTFGRQSYEYQLIAISVDNAIRALAARAKEV